jgi:hypothetical protein
VQPRNTVAALVRPLGGRKPPTIGSGSP